MDMFGWEQLNCDYFETICIDHLSPRLSSYGFRVTNDECVGEVRFLKDDAFLRLSYWLESAPHYEPIVEIGTIYVNRAKAEVPEIPLWFVIGEDKPEARYAQWTFLSQKQLTDVLVYHTVNS